jgi:uncharacterized protein (DUF1778 family)
MAVASDRLDLKLSSEDKELLIQAAAIEGMSLAAFVRSAAKKQASEAILRERQLQLSQREGVISTQGQLLRAHQL